MTPDDGATDIYDFSDETIGTLPSDDFASIEPNNEVLLLIDSWTGQTNTRCMEAFEAKKVEPLVIPKGTTADLQPLDTIFNRQYKKFAKRLIERAAYEGILNSVTSREGIILMHSYMWDQFSSRVYSDMVRYAWKKTDPNHVDEELLRRPPPRMVHEIQFELDCSSRCQFDN